MLELLYAHYDAGPASPRVASIQEVAEARFTSTAAVKMALQSLYDKFDLVGEERNKEALARRAPAVEGHPHPVLNASETNEPAGGAPAGSSYSRAGLALSCDVADCNDGVGRPT